MHMQAGGATKPTVLDAQRVDVIKPPARALTTWLTSSTRSLDLLHRRLGHLHANAVTHMVDDGPVTSTDVSNREPLSSPCEPCFEGRQTHEVIHKRTPTHADHDLTDVREPSPTLSQKGYKYCITPIDDKSHRASASPQRLKALISQAELETGQRVKTLNRTLLDKVRAMLSDTGLPCNFLLSS